MSDLLSVLKYAALKKYSTLSGTLVYFLLTGTAPFLLWLTILIGNVNFNYVITNELFTAVQPYIEIINEAVGQSANGASIILLATALYSSTNFFYHLRRIGELIYGNNKSGSTVKLRLYAVGCVFAIIIASSLFAGVGVFGRAFLNRITTKTISNIAYVVFLFSLVLVAAIAINLYVCPHKIKISQVIAGSILTVVLWVVFAFGFMLYLRFADPSKIYGKITAVVVFLLWCYIMINCMLIGVIYNEKQFVRTRNRL